MTSGQLTRTRGIRYRADVGFEAKCNSCATKNDGAPWYWPLTLEFWNPSHGMGRCRACYMAYDRRKQQEYRASLGPDAARARDRARYRKNRKWILIKRAEYEERTRPERNAAARRRYAERKAAA